MKRLIYIIVIAILFSCGSSERVITNEGKVYEIKGNTFYNNGNDVTDELTEIEKERIQTILDKRLEAEKEIKEKQENIEETLKQLRKREDELKTQQKQLESKIDNREEARENFFAIRKNLNDVKNEYQQLEDKGELSVKEETKWQKRLKKLEQKLKQAELKVDN
jgi:chromosome segregation ATPase